MDRAGQAKGVSETGGSAPRRPSTAEVLATFNKLLSQAKTDKVSAWSNRTVEKALGWANLAERARSWPEMRQPRLCILSTLVENPCLPEGVRAICVQQLAELPQGKVVLQQSDNDIKLRDDIVRRQLPKRLRYAGIVEDELVKRAACEEVRERLRGKPNLAEVLEKHATEGHPWTLELINRLAATGDSWAVEFTSRVMKKSSAE